MDDTYPWPAECLDDLQKYWLKDMRSYNQRELEVPAETRVLDDLQVQLGRLTLRSNELYRMVKFLREHEGECLGDHPDWIAGMDKLLDGEHFDALTELKHLFR